MENCFGMLSFFIFVTVPAGGERVREKRVTLASVSCEYSDCKAVLENFRDENPMLHKANRIHAEFIMRELID
jgi:UDP-N-acetylmuramyl tripeptide synthase